MKKLVKVIEILRCSRLDAWWMGREFNKSLGSDLVPGLKVKGRRGDPLKFVAPVEESDCVIIDYEDSPIIAVFQTVRYINLVKREALIQIVFEYQKYVTEVV